MANIKKIKIGATAYDIVDASVPGQINTAIGKLDSTATVASESADGTITITKTVAETDGKIGNGSGSTATYTTAKVDTLVSSASQSAKDYADGLISGLGTVMTFKGTVASEADLKAIASAKVGEVYVVTADGSEWVCKEDISEAKASAWEKFGTTDVKNALYKDSNTFTDGYILKADGTAGKVKAVAANGAAVGLGNVTNNRQVKGVASGTTNGHIVTWGADGYTVADGGVLGTAAHSNAADFDVKGAAEGAQEYADAQDALQYATSNGAHTHTVTGNVKVYKVNPTNKYMKATATGGKVTLGGTTTFVTGYSPSTKKLVTSSIAVGGMVTGVTVGKSSKTCYSASYDSANECLDLTAVTFDAVGNVTVDKNASAITYATGAAASDGAGAEFLFGLGNPTTGTVSVGTFTQPTIALSNDGTSTTSGVVAYVQSVSDLEATSPITSGTAASAGAHEHSIKKRPAQQ